MKLMLPLNGSPMHRVACRLATLPAILLLASCQIGQTRPVAGDNCAGWSPITPAKTDVIATRTADQLLAHNCHGVAAKCWKAPNDRAAAECKALTSPKQKPAPKR